MISAILRDSSLVMPLLFKAKFTADHFAFHRELSAYLILHEMWVRGNKIDLVSFYQRIMHDKEFGRDFRAVAYYLFDVWHVFWWPEDMMHWWDGIPDAHSCVQCGLAAAAKVRWLASRRNIIYRANTAIRDAVDGVCGPDEYDILE